VDRWKFYAVTHRDHVIMNPLSSEALDELLALAAIPAGARVLDIGCGKAELLIRLTRLGAREAVGVELSPYTAREARERVRALAPEAAITILEQDGATFAAEPGSFDVTACAGASWIFEGHRGTLRALARWTRPGGLVLVAEPFWRIPPAPEYLASQELRADEFGSHASNVADGEAEGLIPLFARAAEATEWDRYEGMQWHAAEEWARENPSDPDRAEILRKVRENRDAYLRWGREALGDGLYLFRKPGP
jgi:SAM-dependent methyltransferase